MDTTTQPRILSYSDAVAIADIVRAAHSGQRVARVFESGEILYGTARSIGDQNGNHASGKDDVRDVHLRVTLTNGFDHYWPMAELVADIKVGNFVVNPS